MNLTENSKIYFIGIGGIAMSAVAGIAKELRYEVSGSDSKAVYSPAKDVLDDLDIPYTIGYSEENIKNAKADFYIASSGEDESNPEVAYLVKEEIKIYSLSELLYELYSDKLRIVVTGTHGKSSTTAMLGKALQSIDDSSFMTGAVLIDEKKNFHNGDGHYVVFEGDEYKALYDDPTPKFQQYKPDIALLTNLEFDHPDMYSSLEEIASEFEEMIHNMPDDGVIVYNSDNAELVKMMHKNNLGQISFGIDNPADFIASNIITFETETSFDVTCKEKIEQYKINVFGKINVYNSLAVIALLRTLGFSVEQVQEGLSAYQGIKRRFEFVGERAEVKVFDDYAHHPTAIKETLALAKLRFPNTRIWAIFEPHTYSRTQATLPDLAKAFSDADHVLIAEIYPAREQKHESSITGQQVVDEIAKHHASVRLVKDKDDAKIILFEDLKPNDIVIVMAVGDFNQLAKELLN